MRKQHRMFLLIIALTAAAASAAWTMPSRVLPIDCHTSKIQLQVRFGAKTNRTRSETTVPYIRDARQVRFSGTRLSVHYIAKRFAATSHVSARGTLYKPSIGVLYSVFLTNALTSVRISHIPLNRGPTHNV